jgi:hypothetical protein
MIHVGILIVRTVDVRSTLVMMHYRTIILIAIILSIGCITNSEGHTTFAVTRPRDH